MIRKRITEHTGNFRRAGLSDPDIDNLDTELGSGVKLVRWDQRTFPVRILKGNNIDPFPHQNQQN